MNGPPSHQRKFDWLEVELAEVKAVRRGLDCSINDVVLTVVTSAVREFMKMRGVDPSEISFKISAPVSVRKEEERGALGNRVRGFTPLRETSRKPTRHSA